VLDHTIATRARVLPVDIRRFPWIRRLAADYAFDFARLDDFFAGNPLHPSAWRDAIARVQRHPRQRDKIADVVETQQRRRGAPAEALAAAALLRDANSVAIVTGQQAGLFGGPLFTLLKALTALTQADRVRAEYGVPVVTVFWVDAEDHDWDEVKTCRVLDADMGLRSITLDRPGGSGGGPVARVRLDETIEAAVGELAGALGSTEFSAAMLDGLRRAYRPGTGMAEAFARWLELVLGPRGLVVYDSSDPAAKPLLANLFAAELDRAGGTSRLAAEAGRALEARGYHVQVTPAEGSVGLFDLGRGREPIRADGDRFQVGDATVSKAVLLERLRRAPQEFSPNVLLRPLSQDTLFPTVCYVAGPNELAYLGQLKHAYEAFGVPMPLFLQRATATIVDANAMRFLTRADCPLESLAARDEALLNGLLAAQLPPSVEAAMQAAAREIEERMQRLVQEVPRVDATLEGAARSTLSRMQDDLGKLQGKIIQAAKRKDETLRRQFTHAQAQSFPGGHPQEREVGVVYFLNKYGPTFVDRLGDELGREVGQHLVIAI
jgi:bacillithiol biosynthesis cysteine-adding enzyme BshC